MDVCGVIDRCTRSMDRWIDCFVCLFAFVDLMRIGRVCRWSFQNDVFGLLQLWCARWLTIVEEEEKKTTTTTEAVCIH